MPDWAWSKNETLPRKKRPVSFAVGKTWITQKKDFKLGETFFPARKKVGVEKEWGQNQAVAPRN